MCAAFALAVSVQGSVSAAPQIDVDQAQRQVEALYHQAEQATERYDEARMALQDAERKFARAQKLAAAQQSTVTELQKSVGAFAANAYRNGGIDQTLQLVFSDDPEAFLDRASDLDTLSTREAGALRKVVEARRELQANQAAAAQELAVVEAERKALATEKAEVEKNLRAAREVLNSLQAKDRTTVQRASRDDNNRGLLKNLPLPNPRAARAIEFALAQLGDRYVWGAAGPDGWDCSGLTMVAWSKAGVSLPHSSAQQFSEGVKVPRSELQPGDLVFFYSPVSHVGLYIGNGKMVHAPNPSRRVEIAPIDEMPFAGAVRP